MLSRFCSNKNVAVSLVASETLQSACTRSVYAVGQTTPNYAPGDYKPIAPGIYTKIKPFSSFGGSMTMRTSLFCGTHSQIRHSYTDTMPKLPHDADLCENYRKNKTVPYTINKNVLGYTSLLLAGGSTVFMGKEFYWYMMRFLGPSKGDLASCKTVVDISNLNEGELISIKYRGKVVFVKHRSDEEIQQMKNVSLKELKHPQTDESRFPFPKWLVLEAVCPHLGCAPIPDAGDYDGYFCPCHGSHFDKCGRIIKGPSPTNMQVPPYKFDKKGRLVVGEN